MQEALAAQGFAFEVREFPDSTRTSVEAAAAIGCSVAQIAKSWSFVAPRAAMIPISNAIWPSKSYPTLSRE